MATDNIIDIIGGKKINADIRQGLCLFGEHLKGTVSIDIYGNAGVHIDIEHNCLEDKCWSAFVDIEGAKQLRDLLVKAVLFLEEKQKQNEE